MIANIALSGAIIAVAALALIKAANAAEAIDRRSADAATTVSLICQSVITIAAIAWVWS